MLFSLEKTRVKSGTVLIETVLSGDYLYLPNWARGNFDILQSRSKIETFKIAIDYRGSPQYAFFGTWKKPCYMKLVLVGLYCGPLLTLIPPLTRT